MTAEIITIVISSLWIGVGIYAHERMLKDKFLTNTFWNAWWSTIFGFFTLYTWWKDPRRKNGTT